MAKITSLALMRQYVLRKLGSPVIQVELSTDQLEQAIEDSVQYFQIHNTGEGNYTDFLGLELQNGVSAYDVSDMNIEATIDTYLTFDSNGISTLFTTTHNLLYHDWVTLGNYPGSGRGTAGMALAGYEIAINYLEDIKDTFDRIYHAQYSRAREEILITPTPTITGIALLEVYRREVAENLYNNELVKALSVVESEIQWAKNLRKHTWNLPGGGGINWQEMMSDAREDKKELQQRIIDESAGPAFFIE